MNTTSSRDEALMRAAVRGVFRGFDDTGEPLVDFPANENRRPVAAISTVPLAETDRNRQVVLLFEDGDLNRPIIVGLRQPPIIPIDAGSTNARPPLDFEVDGERLVYTAQREILFRCGKASIHLLNDGSIRIRGTNVLTRASATNRIRGGNVQIN
jgi:hypothetical protein